VLAGVSGSGKSTLAFDTLYAEGQRRFVTSLSTYARQFLERLPRPQVDFISNLPPAIAIERKNRVTNARSTVGTATEIQDHLRLLFARVGETWCAACERPVPPGTLDGVAREVLARFAGQRVALAAPLPRRPGERPGEERRRLAREGHTRLLDGAGRALDLAELSAREFAALRSEALLLVDRLALRGEASGARLREALAAAFARGAGVCALVPETGPRAVFREGFACLGCARRFAAPEPALFSFNSPLGACPGCQGFGRVPVLDRERVVPDPGKSLAGGAITPFATPSGRRAQQKLLRACRAAGVDACRPFAELPEAAREWVFAGGAGGWRGVRGHFERLERKRYKVQNRVLIARYRRFDPCRDCRGARLRAEALCVRVGGRRLPELAALPLAELRDWLEGLDLEAGARARAARLLFELRARVATAVEVGLGYVALDRPTRTLSGGEAQRIQLASALGGTLTASLYVLDEPSVGLHARDVERLVGVLRAVRDQGNTVVVVEHAPELVAAADHVVELGPGAGRRGGQVVVEGPVDALRAHPDSPTGRALRGELSRAVRRPRPARGRLVVVGARAHNLRDLCVEIPLGQLVAVTGVSGAGKTSLVRSVLVGHLLREPERGECRAIEGAEALREVVVVGPAGAGRGARSNPATLSKAFDGIRRRFAATREARARGAGPGFFSFNVPGGRCEVCEGAGEVVVDMQFLDDVRMPCEACGGRRFRPEALEVRVHGLSIADVLERSVEEALEIFADDPGIEPRLRPLARAGLGYLALGQPLGSLSSGEAQRLRLARLLAEGSEGTLTVLDEPTTGLHPLDVANLLDGLDELVRAGGSALVVEHNLDLIEAADHVIDLGPEGGPGGGELVAEGPPEAIARCQRSRTGAALRRFKPWAFASGGRAGRRGAG